MIDKLTHQNLATPRQLDNAFLRIHETILNIVSTKYGNLQIALGGVHTYPILKIRKCKTEINTNFINSLYHLHLRKNS